MDWPGRSLGRAIACLMVVFIDHIPPRLCGRSREPRRHGINSTLAIILVSWMPRSLGRVLPLHSGFDVSVAYNSHLIMCSLFLFSVFSPLALPAWTSIHGILDIAWQLVLSG